MKSKAIFTQGVIGEGIIGDPPVDTRHGPKTKSFGYQVLGFGSGVSGPTAYNVQYLVVAGGAAGNNYYGGGGGGAGGMRIISCKTFEVEGGTSYPIQVGDGGPSSPPGSGVPAPTWPTIQAERAGEPSIFSTLTSAGGGSGGRYSGGNAAQGGSGGGGGAGVASGPTRGTGGDGNIPAIPAPLGGPQGNPGGQGNAGAGGGAGGHGQAGGTTTNPNPMTGLGGNGTATDISGTCTTYAGGGGHGSYGPEHVASTGGTGGGGDGGPPAGGQGQAGQANTGGGAGGAGGLVAQGQPSQPGGSGIVIIRRLTACSSTTSGTDSTCGCDTIHKFTGDGIFVA